MCTLREANRLVIEAIEAPPDTGEEPRLDRLAADLWAAAREDGPSPDPGRLCRLRYALATIADRTHEERARRLRRAREAVDAYAAGRTADRGGHAAGRTADRGGHAAE